MNGLETAIRNALERSDRTNAETRARIYQSARQALESGLRKQNINDPETIAYQRHRLEALIHSIELEERNRLDDTVAPPDEPARQALSGAPVSTPDVESPAAAPAPTRSEPQLFGGETHPPSVQSDHGLTASRDERIEPSADMSVGTPLPDDVDRAAEVRVEEPMRPRKPRRRGFYSRIFIMAVLLVSLGMGAWWVYSAGVLLTAAERDTSVPNPPPKAEEEDFTGNEQTSVETQEPKALDAQSGFSDNWVEVFEPKQIASIRPRSNALVDVVTASDGTAVRVVSRSSDADGSVEITVPAEVLREMAGKVSTIALTVQSSDDKPVQISVSCDFGRLGDCARHRFTVNPEKSDALFRVSFERAMAPGTPGRILLNGDLGGEDRGVNLYSVRILPGE